MSVDFATSSLIPLTVAFADFLLFERIMLPSLLLADLDAFLFGTNNLDRLTLARHHLVVKSAVVD